MAQIIIKLSKIKYLRLNILFSNLVQMNHFFDIFLRSIIQSFIQSFIDRNWYDVDLLFFYIT